MPMPCNSHWAGESEPAWWVDVIPSKANKGNAVWIPWWPGPWSRCSDHQGFQKSTELPTTTTAAESLGGSPKEPQSGKLQAKLGWGVQPFDIPCSPSHFLIGKASCRRVSGESLVALTLPLASCVILGWWLSLSEPLGLTAFLLGWQYSVKAGSLCCCHYCLFRGPHFPLCVCGPLAGFQT